MVRGGGARLAGREGAPRPDGGVVPAGRGVAVRRQRRARGPLLHSGVPLHVQDDETR